MTAPGGAAQAAPRTRLEILPVPGMGEVRPGDDLAALITTAAPWLCDGDVLVVTSKIVSKAEGRLVAVPAEGPEREAARESVLAAETARPVASRGGTRIVQTHHGFVMASAGIDASNVERTSLVLLPKDPDASARALRGALAERFGLDVAVVVSDTMGRPWRLGLTDVALGAAGIDALRDHRGEVDPHGNPLYITQMAVVDELAAAAELVKGKCDQVPVAVVRGYLPASARRPATAAEAVPSTEAAPAAGTGQATEPARGAVGGQPDALARPDGPGASVLVRDAALDLFSLGTAEARADGLRAAARLDDPVPPPAAASAPDAASLDGPAPRPTPAAPATASLDDPAPRPATDPALTTDPARVERALRTVVDRCGPATRLRPLAGEAALAALRVADRPVPEGATAVLCHLDPATSPAAAPMALIRLGADLHRLRAALAAEGLTSIAVPAPEDGGAGPAGPGMLVLVVPA